MAAMGLWVSHSLRYASRVPRTTVIALRCLVSMRSKWSCDEQVEPFKYDEERWREDSLPSKRWVHKFPVGLTGGVQILNAKVTQVKSPKCAIDEKGRIGLYGRIDAYDISGFSLSGLQEFIPIYNRERTSCEYVKLGDPIGITGPPRGIFVDDRRHFVQIAIDLYAIGRERCKGIQLASCILEWHEHFEDDIYVETIETDNATVEITAAVISDAVEATVELGCTENPSGVLEKVVAYIRGDRIPDLDTYKIVLFDSKATKEQISPNPDGTVQLWCSALALPADGEMLLEIVTSSGDGGGSPDLKDFRFPAKLMGQCCRTIQVKSATVLLNVYWSSMHTDDQPGISYAAFRDEFL